MALKLRKFEWITSLKLRNSFADRNLNAIFDSTTSLTDNVNTICKTAYMYICDACRYMQLVVFPMSSRVSLANTLVSSYPDYCPLLYVGMLYAAIKFSGRNSHNILYLYHKVKHADWNSRVQNSMAKALTFVLQPGRNFTPERFSLITVKWEEILKIQVANFPAYVLP